MLGNRNTRQSTGQKKMQPGSGLKLYIGACEILYPDVTVVGTALVFSTFRCATGWHPKNLVRNSLWGMVGHRVLRLKLPHWAPHQNEVYQGLNHLWNVLGTNIHYRIHLLHPSASICSHMFSNHPECLIRGQCYQKRCQGNIYNICRAQPSWGGLVM